MRIPGIPYVQGRNAYTDRDGRKYGIAIHNTANDASAEQEASYATRRTDGVSAHLYVDGDSVVQSLDTDSRAGHAGSSEGNEHAIAVEITGVNAWSWQQWRDRVAWAELARVLAIVCHAHGIEPRRASVAEMRANPRVRAFYSHDDMRRAWGGTTHTDPGPNFPWDHLLAAVRQEMDGDDMTPEQLLDALDSKRGRSILGQAVADASMPATESMTRRGIPASTLRNTVQLAAIYARDAQLTTAAHDGRDLVDEPAIVAGVLAGLTPQDIAAAIPQDIARQVADMLAARLAA